MGALLNGWNRFFFGTLPAWPLGLFRIAFGLVVVVDLLYLRFDGQMWFGPDGVLPYSDWMTVVKFPRVSLFPLLPESSWSVEAVLCLGVVAGCFLTMGLQSRACSVLVWLVLASLHHRNPFLFNSGDTLLRVLGFWLMFAESGRAWSFDRLLRQARGVEPDGEPRVVAWPIRMMQLQVCWMYLSTGVWKAQGPLWRSGLAVYYVLGLPELSNWPLPAFARSVEFSMAATWGTLLVEIGLPFALWWRRYRYAAIGCGVAFHFGLEYCLNVAVFQWIAIASMILFAETRSKAREAVVRRSGGSPEPALTAGCDIAKNAGSYGLATIHNRHYRTLHIGRFLRIAEGPWPSCGIDSTSLLSIR
ncbi:MAG: HTTM domain-containing protein [Planctomycetaceae bacterium]